MGHGTGQFDVPHAVATDLGEGDLHAAFFAHHAAMLEALVLAAQTLVVLDGTEDLGAEQAVALRFEGAVVDGLRLLDFAEGPGTNHFRRRQADADVVEIFDLPLLAEKVE